MSIISQIREALDNPVATSVTAGSTALMGYLELAYHVSQDFLGWASLALGVIIGIIVVRIKLVELKMKIMDLRIKQLRNKHGTE